MRGNRFRLITLGRLTLLGPASDEDAALAKRRLKLAVLAVLAMARRPITRDTLVEMFWPDQDEARARHSLSNALSSLRRALGQRAIATRDADVALESHAALDVDALDLTNAAQSGDFGRVIELYDGPFMHGVHVDGSTSFDQWVDRERRRLDALFVQACTRHGPSLARAGRWQESHAVAMRWLDVAPLSVDAALLLLESAKAPGTRQALVQALDDYEQLRLRLRRELELSPEPPVRELADRIRDALAASEASSSPGIDRPPAPEVAPPPDVGAVDREATSSEPASDASRIGRRLRRGAVAAVAVAVAIAGTGIAIAVRGREATGRAGIAPRPVIAVLPMELGSRDSTITWLGDGIPEMILGKLGRDAEVDVVPTSRLRAVITRSGRRAHDALDDAVARDLAQRVGATLVARGTIGRDDDRLVLDLTVRDVRSGNLVTTAVLSQADALALADEAAARILDAANAGAPGPQLAGLETSSLAAYRHYMRALEAGRSGRLSEHDRELDAAIALDSGFIAVVRTRLGSALSANDTALVRRLRATMQRYRSRASEFDRLHQEVSDAFFAGERERSEALGRALVRRYPRDPRAYGLLESTLTSHGALDEAEQVVTRMLALDSLAVRAGPGPCPPCQGFYSIVHLHWRRGDFRGAEAWARRWIGVQPDGATAWSALAWTYSYTQRHDSAMVFMRRAMALSGDDTWAAGELVRIMLVARHYESADSAIALLEQHPTARRISFDLRALLDRERGRFRDATRTMERLDAEVPGQSGFVEIIRADNLRILGEYANAGRRFEKPAHGSPELPFPLPSMAARAFCWHRALAADAYAPTADTVRLRLMADTLEHGCVHSFYGRDWMLFRHVRGLAAMKAGRFAEAERELEQASWGAVEGWTRTTVELARARLALGRPRDAVTALRTGYATRLDAMGRYVPISELDWWMAKMFAAAGEEDSARVYAGYATRAWRDADPEIRRLLAELPSH